MGVVLTCGAFLAHEEGRGVRVCAEVVRADAEVDALWVDIKIKRYQSAMPKTAVLCEEQSPIRTSGTHLEVLDTINIQPLINNAHIIAFAHRARSKTVPGCLGMLADPLLNRLVVFFRIDDVVFAVLFVLRFVHRLGPVAVCCG